MGRACSSRPGFDLNPRMAKNSPHRELSHGRLVTRVLEGDESTDERLDELRRERPNPKLEGALNASMHNTIEEINRERTVGIVT